MIKRDDALKTVVKFTTTLPPQPNGQPVFSTGTGFFMMRDGTNQLYIITARHVAAVFNNTTMVEMMGANNKTVSILLSKFQNGLPMKKHPTADVCAIQVDNNIYNSIGSNTMIFATSLINTQLITNLSRDVELTSIGFPVGLGANLAFQPFTFRSFPSSSIINNLALNGYTSDIFVLENPSCGGYSGCPVLDLGYLVRGGISQTFPTVFYGIMHGTISDNTGGKMAIVTPAYYILQII